MESQRRCRLYDEAFLELEPQPKLKERIEAAELAIRERAIELRSGGAPTRNC